MPGDKAQHLFRLAVRAQRQPLWVLLSFAAAGALGLLALGDTFCAWASLVLFAGFDLANASLLAGFARHGAAGSFRQAFRQLSLSTGLRHTIILLAPLAAAVTTRRLGEALYLDLGAASLMLLATFQCSFSAELLGASMLAPLACAAASLWMMRAEPFVVALVDANVVLLAVCAGVSAASSRVRHALIRRESEREIMVCELQASRDEAQAARLRAETLAYKDGLTGLANRVRFQDGLDAALDGLPGPHGEGCGLLLIDLDQFKEVNDVLGHDAGDRLLCAVAGTLRDAFPEALVARLGGDEFAVLWARIEDQTALTDRADAARLAIQRVDVAQDLCRTASASVGVAFTCDQVAPGGFMKDVDIALYEAKRGGRDRWCLFRPELRAQVERRFEVLRGAREGLEAQEFEPWYQPIFDLQAGALVGFEALARWRRGDGDILSPGAFQVALDDAEWSLRLGDVMLERVLCTMKAWDLQGVHFGRVALNLCTAQFRRGDLQGRVASSLKRWGVSSQQLAFEITETIYLSDQSSNVASVVQTLHDLGIQIALDDFGTGYASLGNLRQFPIDILKIDKSFVAAGDTDLIRLVIDLGRQLGKCVVAEGVERVDQENLLRDLGCPRAQGFLYAPAMSAVEVPRFVAAQACRRTSGLGGRCASAA